MGAALARDDNVGPAVLVEIGETNLQADARAVFGNDELRELTRRRVPLEVVEAAGFGVPRIVSAVRFEAAPPNSNSPSR